MSNPYGNANALINAEREETATVLATLAAATQANHRAVSMLTKLLTKLSTQIEQQQQEIKQLKQPKSNKKPKKDQGSYCWSHGYLVDHRHNSETCHWPKPGHKCEATRENPMGGNMEGKPE